VSRAAIGRFAPIADWLPRYERSMLRGDVLAGIAVAAMIVPTDLGYAGIAGIPLQNGLYAAAAGAIVYALFCTSRHISTGPSSSLAAVAGGAVLVAGVEESQAAELVAAITLVTGALFLLLAVLRLGWIARFLSRAVVTGRVPFLELAAHIEMADAVAHLRYPSARETSAALLRVLAQGRPTIMGDLEHLADVPQDAVIRADVADEEGETTRAILKLAASPALRARLGATARAFVERAHAPTLTAEAYADAIERAIARPRSTVTGWPDHWAALARA